MRVDPRPDDSVQSSSLRDHPFFATRDDEAAHCAALFVTAPQSDSGKTTVVAALARYWRNRGKRVRVFKTGPDFIDPKFHEVASGEPAYQLDLGMMGEPICRQHLHQAAKTSDLILIEGVMGMFDGRHSSAELARRLGLPMLAVVPAAKMAQTFGAIVYGLAHYDGGSNLFGVVANQVGSPGHAKLLASSVPEGIEFCGYLPKDEQLSLPDRHLGLVQAEEFPELDSWLDGAADKLGAHCELPWPPEVAFPSVPFEPGLQAVLAQQPLQGKTIAVARDAAFAFVYHDNLALLTQLGAEVVLFSPLVDPLPDCDALYLPGGYPELHGDALSRNQGLRTQIQRHVAEDKPLVAECGGMLYLLDQLTDASGQGFTMAGILPGNATLHPKLQRIGMLTAEMAGHRLTGHCFHYSSSEIALTPIAEAKQGGLVQVGEPVYQHGSVLASYVHWYFASAPSVIAQWFGAARMETGHD